MQSGMHTPTFQKDPLRTVTSSYPTAVTEPLNVEIKRIYCLIFFQLP